MIDAAGLSLVALDAPAEAQRLFRERFGDHASPLDPQRWAALEADHPTIFAGMIPLWCQKAISPCSRYKRATASPRSAARRRSASPRPAIAAARAPSEDRTRTRLNPSP